MKSLGETAMQVTVIPWPFSTWNPQASVFAQQVAINMHALYTLKGIAEWLLICDIDEYLELPNLEPRQGKILSIHRHQRYLRLDFLISVQLGH
jgi:hypothetical protein